MYCCQFHNHQMTQLFIKTKIMKSQNFHFFKENCHHLPILLHTVDMLIFADHQYK